MTLKFPEKPECKCTQTVKGDKSFVVVIKAIRAGKRGEVEWKCLRCSTLMVRRVHA